MVGLLVYFHIIASDDFVKMLMYRFIIALVSTTNQKCRFRTVGTFRL